MVRKPIDEVAKEMTERAPKKLPPVPRTIVCHWQYKKEKGKDRVWHLIESYGVDQDGYPIQEDGKYPSTGGDECSWYKWVYKEGHQDSEPIWGRAVTMWDSTFGVTLSEFNPPEQTWWLSEYYLKRLKKVRGWHELIAGGDSLLMGTAREVERKYLNVGREGCN